MVNKKIALYINILLVVIIMFFVTCQEKKTNDKLKSSVTGPDTLFAQIQGTAHDLYETTSFSTLIAQDWIQEDDKLALENSSSNDDMFAIRTFSFNTDGSFLQNVRGYCEAGDWSFNKEEKTILLEYDDDRELEYKLRLLGPTDLRLTNITNGSETILNFVSDGRQIPATDSNNAFLPRYSNWRNKPTKPETDSAIKSRVKQHLQFFVLYLKGQLARDAETISFYGFPTCIEFYNGGVGITENEITLSNWKDCFYDQAEAERGTNIMKQILKKKYNWPAASVGWVKQDLAVLEQMLVNIKSITSF
jgi:hypothetical protein